MIRKRWWGNIKAMPIKFPEMIVKYGNSENKAPVGKSSNDDPGHYTNCWDYDYLAARLFNQWRYLHAISVDKRPAKNWFWDTDLDPKDWKTTAMRVINAQFSGNASYEWFDWKDGVMYRTNYFARINDTSDPRLNNPFLDFVFNNPELTLGAVMRDFRKITSEKKN